MATIDINKLIQESVSKDMSTDNDSSTTREAYLESIVTEVKKTEGDITVSILEEAFPEVFQDDELKGQFIERLNAEGVEIPGFNVQLESESEGEDKEISESTSVGAMSTTIGLIASGLTARKYLSR